MVLDVYVLLFIFCHFALQLIAPNLAVVNFGLVGVSDVDHGGALWQFIIVIRRL